MQPAVNSIKKTSRLPGVLYLLLAIAGAYALMYVPSHIMVVGDLNATAQNILTHELLFRTGIAAHLICQVIFLVLAIVLYQLFRDVNAFQAKMLVVFVIVQIPIVLLIESFNVTSIMILKGEVLKTLGNIQKQDFAFLFLKLHTYGVIILELFWGVWLIPFGLLVYKSGRVPRIFGVLLVIGAIGYIVESFTFVLFPGYLSLISQYTMVLYSIGELPIILWLLIIGVRSGQKKEG